LIRIVKIDSKRKEKYHFTLPFVINKIATKARMYPLTCHKFGVSLVNRNFIPDATAGNMTIIDVIVSKFPPFV
jgi:hypothetical protein